MTRTITVETYDEQESYWEALAESVIGTPNAYGMYSRYCHDCQAFTSTDDGTDTHCVHCGRDVYADDDDTQDEPVEGDYILSPAGYLGSTTRVTQVEHRLNAVFATEDAALKYVVRRQYADSYWTSIWRMSDHGNLSLID